MAGQGLAQKTAEMTDIFDIKGPLNLEDKLILFILGFVLLLFAAGAVYGLLRFLKKRMVRAENIAPKPAHEIAYEALEKLKNKDYLTRGKVKEFYQELSLIVRYYLENRFNLRAPEMTTEEFMEKAKETSLISSEHKGLLKDFLLCCDLVKFAKYGPSKEEIDSSLKSAQKLIDQTKEIVS